MLLNDANLESPGEIAAYLRHHLPMRWRESYIASLSRPANVVRFVRGSFEYILDLYSELEMVGEVSFDQTAEDRVVAVLGSSAAPTELRDRGRMRGWLGDNADIVGATRDKGHFIAHCIGGGLDVNVFSQDRKLNRGWSDEGKLYREMERYCQQQPGTFCFSRPIYTDESSVPRWIEFGLLRQDQSLWIETFDNVSL